MSNLTIYPRNTLRNTLRDFWDLTEDFGNTFVGDERALRTTIDEDTDNYVVRAEVPGIDRDNIDINYENNVMSITANYEEKDENYLRKGKYCRAYSVPDVDAENINANLKDGILTITLPKSEKAKPKRIQINNE